MKEESVVRHSPLLVVLALGCTQPANPLRPPAGATPAPLQSVQTAIPAAASAPDQTDGSTPPASPPCVVGAPRVFRVLPCVAEAIVTRDDHMGFSKDGRYFGYCEWAGEQESLPTCLFLDRTTNKPITVAPGQGDKSFESFFTQHGIRKMTEQRPPLSGPFPWNDLAFVTQQALDVKKDIVRVQVGAVVDGEVPVYPISFTMGPHPFNIPDFHMREKADVPVIDVSPDGKQLGVVALAHGDRFFEAGDMKVMPVTTFVGQVYNDAGFVRHKAESYGRAAELFAKAVQVRPEAALFSYNLACAYARMHDARVEAALRRAVQLDRGIARRAAGEADFVGVKSEPWFLQVVR